MMRFKVKSVFGCPTHCCSRKCVPVFKENFLVSVNDINRKLIVWEPKAFGKEVFLTGHERVVTALCLSPCDGVLLCSCSTDRVIVWDLSSFSHGCPITESNPTGVEVGVDLGHVECCAFSWDNSWLALCKQTELWILKLNFLPSEERALCTVIQSVETHGVIETGSSCGVCTFVSEDKDLLVHAENSRSFKVWDVAALSLLYHSASMSSGLITCMMFAANKLLLGTNSGVVTMLKVTRSNTYLLAKINVAMTFRNGKATDACGALAECEESGCNVEEQACIISSMHVVNRVSPSLLLEEGFDCLDDAESLLRSILLPAPVLIVCCNMGIAMYDCGTQDCLACLMLSDIFEEKLSSRAFVPLVDFVVAGGKDICDIYCISKMLIGGVEVCMAVLSAETNDLDLPDKFISMIPGEPLNLKSPLRCRAMRYKQPSVYGPTSGSSDCKSVRKQKSSGYGRPTRMQMFCPITNTHKKNCRNSTQVRRSLLDTVDGCSRQLLQQCGPPLTPVNKVSVWSSSCTATHLAVSGDGKHIACSSNRSDISVLNLAKLDTTSVNLLGHDKSINSLHFSLNSKWMVSSSTDGTAKVWDWTHRRCVLNVDNTVGSKYKRNGAKDKDSLDTVKQARFLFMDQFLLIAERGHLQLISHLLCEEPLSTGRSQHLVDWKRVLRIKMQTQHVTCFTAANHFHSYLVVCGCSSKAIKVYDLNAESLCLDIAEAHQRPPHCVVQLEGSAHSSLPAAMFDLILSAAVCDGVRLWDLRSARCVQKYSQHTNRCYGSGVDVSPCGRYIAASSDDKAVYVYDIRNSYKPLGKLLGLGDVVMDVAFSPCAPLLAAIALNARLVTFCP